MKNKTILWAILIAFVLIILAAPAPEGLSIDGKNALILVMIAAFLWLGEMLPMGASALLIIALAPILGIIPAAKSFQNFSHDIIFLYIGGFIVATAMDLHGLDKRVALWIMYKTGTNKRKTVLGLMIGTAVISAWISSVVVVLALLPIVLGILKIMKTKPGDDDGKLFLLALAYSAIIGGIATPIGSAPNALVMGYLRDQAGINISFIGWMYYGLPLAVVLTFVTWWILVNISFKPDRSRDVALEGYLKSEYKKLGLLNASEKISLFSLILFAILLFTIPQGKKIFGANNWTEGVAALISTIPLFLTGTINWKQANNGISWTVLLLFAAGLSISASLNTSGAGLYMARFIGEIFPTALLPIIFAVFGALFTQITSNTATTAILAPIAIALALVAGINPLIIAIPATLAISLGFLTPIGTALNPIVFGQMPDGNTYLSKTSDYIKGGIAPFIVCLILTIIYSVYIVPAFAL